MPLASIIRCSSIRDIFASMDENSPFVEITKAVRFQLANKCKTHEVSLTVDEGGVGRCINAKGSTAQSIRE